MTATPADITSRIHAALDAIAGAAYRTPLEPSVWLSDVTDADVRLKLECYQPTGSFKIRGALAAIAQLDAAERERGVVTASAGNHGLGVAYAASRNAVRATVVVPETASAAKVSALERFPITLLTGGPNYDTAELQAKDIARQTGAVFISPYNDLWVMAGQGTIGVEMLDDAPNLDLAIIPIGGGGLISGIGAWLKTRRRAVRIVGVQAAASPSMEQALRFGRLVEIPVLPTLADGLAANIEPGSMTFDIARQVVDEIVLVDEDAIGATVRTAFHELHLALEGSAVVGIAAVLGNLIRDLVGKTVTIVITGRNIAAEPLVSLLAGEKTIRASS